MAIRHVFPGVALGKSATEEIMPMTEGLCGLELEADDDSFLVGEGVTKYAIRGRCGGFEIRCIQSEG